MNTNINYNTEDLLHSLPDYISKNITDPELVKAIESKISSDPEFKMEYLNLSETLNLFESYNMESPSDAYFNNLSVRINESIHKETQTDPFFKRFGISLKFALSAFVVLFVITSAVFYFYNSETDKNLITSDQTNVSTDKNDSLKINESGNNGQSHTIPDMSVANDPESEMKNDGIKKTELIDNKSENTKRNNRLSENKSDIQKKEVANSLNENSSVFSKEDEITSVPFKASAFDELAFADNTGANKNSPDLSENSDNTESSESELEQNDDVLISGDSDDDFLEEDIFDLTPEEQLEILKYLKQS